MGQDFRVTPALLSAFGLAPRLGAVRLSGGHINDTFLVEDGDGSRYVLQRINRYVFPSPRDIMENISGVTGFLHEKLRQLGEDDHRKTLSLRTTTAGDTLYQDSDGECWRCVRYVEGARSYETAESPAMLREAGRAFGEFQRLLADFPAHTLHETIRDFHNTPARCRQLWQAARENRAGRLSLVEEELDFAQRREEDAALLMDLLGAGRLPLRVTHNDTKLSNVLFDGPTGKALCVIDLDTVMPGLTAFDFGDSIRAGASTAAEDEADLSRVAFDVERFAAYSEGFLGEAGAALTPLELRTLPDGARLMTFEVGIRFLADYLNGDVYFRTSYPEHNLVRARNQFQLVREMEAKRPQMDQVLSLYR